MATAVVGAGPPSLLLLEVDALPEPLAVVVLFTPTSTSSCVVDDVICSKSEAESDADVIEYNVLTISPDTLQLSPVRL